MQIDRRNFLKKCSAVVTVAALSSRVLGTEAMMSKSSIKMHGNNILFLVVDDLGWADVGYQGNKPKIQTPNIDKLAKSGMIFTDAYAACPVCSPTRASIATGKYPTRLQLTCHIPSMRDTWDKGRPPNDAEFSTESGIDTRNWLPLEEKTIGEAMKELGYKTSFLGKWHLGYEAYHPDKQGFDVQVGTSNFGQPPSFHEPYKRIWPRNQKKEFVQIYDIAKDAKLGEYLTDRLTKEAKGFIKANKNNKWLCYMSYYTVHTPHQGRKDLLARHGGNQYLAMIAALDESVGKLLECLKKEGLDKNTVVVFMSDNGGTNGNAPLRSNKGSTYEGGIREPMIISWPGVTKPGSKCSVPVISMDFFPTFVEIGGGDPDKSTAVDGLSLVKLLKGGRRLDREALYWHFPHRGNIGSSGAIRKGKYKLIEKFRTGKLELYDLSKDIGEKNDLSEELPKIVNELYAYLKTWRKETGAIMPKWRKLTGQP